MPDLSKARERSLAVLHHAHDAIDTARSSGTDTPELMRDLEAVRISALAVVHALRPDPEPTKPRMNPGPLLTTGAAIEAFPLEG